MTLEFLTLLATYVSLGTAIAVLSRKFGVRSTAEYFVAGYRLGGFLSSMTYAATTYSAFMMVGLVGFAYATGVGALGFELAYLVATVSLLSLFAPRVWSMAREKGWVSVSEMLGDLYGSRLMGMLIAAIYLVALLPYTSAQMIGVGSIFEGFGVGYAVGILVAIALCFLWIVVAGVWSVATTDAYQGVWMLSASLIFIAWISTSLLASHGLDLWKAVEVLDGKGLTGLTEFWSINTFLAFTIPWVFFAVTNPQVVQRLYMPINERALKRLIQYFAIYGLTYTVVVTLAGLLGRSLTEVGALPFIKNRDLVTPTILTYADPMIASFIYVSITAAAISTANSIILSVASSFVRDFYERRARVVSPRRSYVLSNAVVACLVALAALIAYARPGFIVEMSVLSSVVLLPLAPITLLAWLRPSRSISSAVKMGAVAALLAGVGVALYGAVVYGPRKAFVVSWGPLPISAWILLISSLAVLMPLSFSKVRRRFA